MSPRNTKPDIASYRPVLSAQARDSLSLLADALGFLVTRRGTYEGLPSVTDLLEALAACHTADPGGTRLALKVLLGENRLLPATPPSE